MGFAFDRGAARMNPGGRVVGGTFGGEGSTTSDALQGWRAKHEKNKRCCRLETTPTSGLRQQGKAASGVPNTTATARWVIGASSTNQTVEKGVDKRARLQLHFESMPRGPSRLKDSSVPYLTVEISSARRIEARVIKNSCVKLSPAVAKVQGVSCVCTREEKRCCVKLYHECRRA